ncbi:MAG: ATP-binding protein [Nitriliruptoraceae bacterium]
MAGEVDARSARRLRRYVLGWALAGLVATVAATALVLRDGIPARAWTIPVLALVAAVAASVHFELPLGGRRLSSNVVEAAVALGLVLAEPLAIVLPIVLGTAAVDRRNGVTGDKSVFNLGLTAMGAVASAGVVWAMVGGIPDLTTGVGVTSLVLALVVNGLVNVVGATGLLLRLDPSSFRLTVRSLIVNSALSLSLAGSFGILGGVLFQVAPVALPVLVLPAWAVHHSLQERVLRISGELDERDLLERTVEGASEGIALLDADGVVELLNPAFAGFLDVEQAALRGQGLLAFLEERTGTALCTLAEELESLQPHERRGASDVRLDERTFALEFSGTFDRLGERTGTVVLLTDVTEQRETEAMRREFVARVSHELRTPLTAIVGFVETLQHRDRELGSADRASYLGVVARQAGRLDRLVSTLLWSSRVDRGAALARPEGVVVAHAVADAVATLGDLLDGDIEVAVDPDLVVTVDPDHLHQILSNLLSNAVSYGRPPLAVTAEPNGDEVTIEVSDAGEGVPPAFERHLFRAFAQASVGDRRTASGLGLGLAIVDGLVAENHGRVRYRRSGGRTRFRVDLPAVLDVPISTG